MCNLELKKIAGIQKAEKRRHESRLHLKTRQYNCNNFTEGLIFKTQQNIYIYRYTCVYTWSMSLNTLKTDSFFPPSDVW